MSEINNQIKSKERVAAHGEVFTSDREVNAMLDLVKDETERIDSRFLEPACGDGNFLAEILRRKLVIVNNRYGKSLPDYEKFSILALMNIYGVDILEDNTEECRRRLYEIWEDKYKSIAKNNMDESLKNVANYILSKNILCGDALSMKQNNGQPIIFPEWSFVMGNMVQRRDFRFDELLSDENPSIGETNQSSLFDTTEDWEFDEETHMKMPTPIKVYPLIDYREVYKVE
nr:SAM-dependent DNA methyltransferase [Ezakiella coagulans]